MSTLIESRTYGGRTEQGVALKNAQMARKFSLGNWTWIRIAVRGWLEDSGSAPAGGSAYELGLCSGTTNLIKDASTTHFVGYRAQNASDLKAQAWQRGATTGANGLTYVGYTSTYQAYGIGKRVGTTGTNLTAAVNNADSRIFIGPNSDLTNSYFRQFVHIIDFTRVSSTQMTIKWWPIGGSKQDTTTSPYMLTRDDYYNLALSAIPSATIINGSSGWFVDSSTVAITNAAVNESVDGYFDGANIAWNQTSPYPVINDFSVIRMA